MSYVGAAEIQLGNSFGSLRRKIRSEILLRLYAGNDVAARAALLLKEPLAELNFRGLRCVQLRHTMQ